MPYRRLVRVIDVDEGDTAGYVLLPLRVSHLDVLRLIPEDSQLSTEDLGEVLDCPTAEEAAAHAQRLWGCGKE